MVCGQMKFGMVEIEGEVAIGVVENNGEFLIMRRSQETSSTGKWTFPGGKDQRR